MPQRPRRKFNETEIGQIETMAGLRLPHVQIAAILGMSKPYFDMLIKKDAAARYALENGRAKASVNIRRRAYEMAINGSERMLIFWLKTQEGWRENDRLELSNPDGSPVVPSVITISVEERRAKIDKYKRILAETEDED